MKKILKRLCTGFLAFATVVTALPSTPVHAENKQYCCLRPLYDEYGNVYIVVDMELKGLIREALIKMILDFDIPLETEE